MHNPIEEYQNQYLQTGLNDNQPNATQPIVDLSSADKPIKYLDEQNKNELESGRAAIETVRATNESIKISNARNIAYNNSLTKLSILQVVDFKWRLKTRDCLTYFTIGLLSIQNILLYVMIIFAIRYDYIHSLKFVLSIIIGATLTQTGYLMRKIFKLIYSPINYKTVGTDNTKQEKHMKLTID